MMENLTREFAYRLHTCVWELTLACTYSCAHCGSQAGRARQGELSTAEALDVADQLAAMRCRRVVLIGGEVFLRDDWDAVAKRMTGAGVEVSIITNGSCFVGDVWDRLERAGVDYVAVSVDGLRENHDRMRMPGSYDVAMGALAQAKRRGLLVSAITVVSSENAGDLEGLYAELSGRGVDAWQLQLCSPFGNAGHSHGLVPSVEQIREVVAFVARKTAARRVDASRPLVLAADNIGYHTAEESSIRGRDGASFQGCAAGLSVMGIDSVGNVRGCESLYDDAFVEGNLRQRRLQDIWEDPGAFAYNRRFDPSRLGGRCRACDVGHLCAAGCRSLNHFMTGDPFTSATCIRER